MVSPERRGEVGEGSSSGAQDHSVPPRLEIEAAEGDADDFGPSQAGDHNLLDEDFLSDNLNSR